MPFNKQFDSLDDKFGPLVDKRLKIFPKLLGFSLFTQALIATVRELGDGD